MSVYTAKMKQSKRMWVKCWTETLLHHLCRWGHLGFDTHTHMGVFEVFTDMKIKKQKVKVSWYLMVSPSQLLSEAVAV